MEEPPDFSAFRYHAEGAPLFFSHLLKQNRK
jgi:hypothetical protein